MGVLKFEFEPEKAGQAAAYLLQLSGGKLSKGFLVKMLYAADWSQLNSIGRPITGDDPYAMPNGPVLSTILNLLNKSEKNPFWDRFISGAAQRNHNVSLLEPAPTDRLSENEMETLRNVHKYMNKMSWSELVDFCHTHFKEWDDPNGSSKPIQYEDMILRSGRREKPFVDELVSIQQEKDFLSKVFA